MEEVMATDIQTTQENRLSIFANVFKSYMGIMPVVTAALAPLLTALNVLPTYQSQRKPLATMAGVLGFLLLAWIFYVRRTIALGSITHGFRWIFNLLPLVLIFGSVGSYITYANTLEASLGIVSNSNPAITRAQALGNASQDMAIPNSVKLQLLYLGMFLCAEGAFVMMALRDYCNDVRHISEYDWMFGAQDGFTPTLPTKGT
jgi:membrane protease YdiL (CAAX protease family)